MKKRLLLEYFWLACKYSVVVAFIALIVRGFLFLPIPVEGNSMNTTLKQNDWVLVEKFTKIKRFDIVVFQLADGNTYIKRVIGLPGETVSYKEDQLYIDGKKMAEPYLAENKAKDQNQNSYTNDFSLEELMNVDKLGKDSYFVIGDNRRVSKDSRSFGAISEDQIIGKAFFIYYPIREMKWIQ